MRQLSIHKVVIQVSIGNVERLGFMFRPYELREVVEIFGNGINLIGDLLLV